MNASSSAIETLSKIIVQNKKEKTQRTVKQMDIEGKKQLMQGEFNAKMMLSRDDVMNELFSKVKEEEVKNINEFEYEQVKESTSLNQQSMESRNKIMASRIRNLLSEHDSLLHVGGIGHLFGDYQTLTKMLSDFKPKVYSLNEFSARL